MRRSIFTSVVLLLALSSNISADVIETGSTRFIVTRNQGGTVIDGPNQIDEENTFGGFTETVETFAWDGPYGGSSYAYQNSNISHGVYQVNLEAQTDADGGSLGNDIAMGYCEGYYEVRFTLDVATDFNVSGSYNSFGEINGAVSEVELRIENLGGGTPSQVIIFETDDCCPSVNHNGTLLPGSYAFVARILGIVDHSFMTSYNTSTSGTNVTMTLDVPQPSPLGDMDCSGAVDFDDLGPFVQALLDPAGYETDHPTCDLNLADTNADESRDGADVATFVNCILLNGCP